MAFVIPACRRACLPQAQIGLRARRRGPALTFGCTRPEPAVPHHARWIHASERRSAKLTEREVNEKLLEVLKRKEGEYQAALKQQSLPNDVSTQITLSKTLKDLSPLSSLFAQHASLSTSLREARTLLSDPDEEIRSMASEEIRSLKDELEALMRGRLPSVLFPPSETSELSALMEIKPGVGGTESTLFLSTLYRMYTRYASLRSWRVEVLSDPSGGGSDSGGIGGNGGGGDAVFKIVGKGAFGELKGERGVHRVQRVPVTDSAGRVHTSTVAVVVLPVIEESGDGTDDLVDAKDVKTEVMRSRGAGGQHVNKTESAVRLTHLPTGISVSMQDSRSQHQNKAWAWQVLRSRLLARRMEAKVEERRSARLSQVKGAGRSDKIRTYNFPQDRLTDHRIGLTITGLDNVLEGEGLEYVIDKLKDFNQNERMEALLQDGEDPGDDD